MAKCKSKFNLLRKLINAAPLPFWLNAAPLYKNLAARVWGGGLHLQPKGGLHLSISFTKSAFCTTLESTTGSPLKCNPPGTGPVRLCVRSVEPVPPSAIVRHNSVKMPLRYFLSSNIINLLLFCNKEKPF